MARLFFVAIAAGLAGAVVEMVFVLPIQHLLGASPVFVFQGIASGALGKSAFTGGTSTALFGLVIHLFVSFVAAGVYIAARARSALVRTRPAAAGMAFGAVCYVVMTFVVIPLSAIGFHPPKSLFLASLSFAIHVFAFGLPIALVSSVLLKRPAAVTVS